MIDSNFSVDKREERMLQNQNKLHAYDTRRKARMLHPRRPEAFWRKTVKPLTLKEPSAPRCRRGLRLRLRVPSKVWLTLETILQRTACDTNNM